EQSRIEQTGRDAKWGLLQCGQRDDVDLLEGITQRSLPLLPTPNGGAVLGGVIELPGEDDDLGAQRHAGRELVLLVADPRTGSGNRVAVALGLFPFRGEAIFELDDLEPGTP